MDGNAAAVRDALTEHDYTPGGVTAVLGEQAFADLGRGRTSPARYALASARQTPLTDLIRMFLLGEPVPGERAAAALPLGAAAALGLVESAPQPAAVVPSVQIQPYPTGQRQGYVVSDFPRGRGRTPASLPPQHVTGIGGASVTLATITPRRQCARTLDLGTGCGVEALLASSHSAEVVASDISGRALACASLTAALSGVAFDLRQGSLFEPVAGERFDLIVANPPFVIAPQPRLVYREAPHRADELSRTVIAQAAQHLAPGGTAVVLCNWLHLPGQPWQERLAQWAPPTCQMRVEQRELLTPSEYVALWLQDSGELDAPGSDERYQSWLSYFADLGAEAVGFGWVVLRDSEQTWFTADDVADAERLPTGEEVVAQLDAFAAMQATSALDILAGEPSWADGVELDRCWSPADPGGAQVFVTTAWRSPVAVDPLMVDLLAGSGSVAERVAHLAGEDDEAADDITVRALLGLRRLLGAGLITLFAARPG